MEVVATEIVHYGETASYFFRIGENKGGDVKNAVRSGGRAIPGTGASNFFRIIRHEIKAQSMTKEEQTIVTSVLSPRLFLLVYR